MKKLTEIDVLKSVCEEAEGGGQVSDVHRTRLSATFGSRFTRAWEALKEGRVKKYFFKPSGRVVWIVVGRERDYLVMSAADFCSCDDFYFQFDKGHLCYHIIAQKLGEATGQFDLIKEEDDFYKFLMKEWKTIKVKLSKKHREERSS